MWETLWNRTCVEPGSPGGNITGLSTTAGPGIYGKKLALLKEAIPSLSRAAFLSNPDNSFSVMAENEAKVAAGEFGATLHTVEARHPEQSNGLSPRQ